MKPAVRGAGCPVWMAPSPGWNNRAGLGAGRGVSRAVDWTVGLALPLVGGVLGVVGCPPCDAANREPTAGLVADGGVELGWMTGGELVDVPHVLAWWGGLELGLTGVLLAVGGVGYMTCRDRSCEQRPADAPPGTVTAAVASTARHRRTHRGLCSASSHLSPHADKEEEHG